MDGRAAPARGTAQVGRAEARAFVPAPTAPLPPELAKMQVEGTELPAADDTAEGAARAHDDAFVAVRLPLLVTMTGGKSAAQYAHAAQRSYETTTPSERERFAHSSFRVHAVRDTLENWAIRPGHVSIIEAGFTELDGQHETARAEW